MAQVPDRLRSLHPNVLLLGAVSLLTDVSSEMAYPILPLFITLVLGAPPAVLGLIEGLAGALADLLKALSGMWSDRIGRRRPLIIGGYALSTAVKPLFAVATSWHHVLAVRLAERVGKGLRGSARDAAVSDCTPPCELGLAYGYRKAMDSLGAFIGPVVAFLLLPPLLARYGEEGAYRAVFALAVVPAAAAVALALRVEETGGEWGAQGSGERKRIELGRLGGPFWRNLAVQALFSLGVFTWAFLVLRALDIGVAPALVPLVYALFNLAYALAAPPAGLLSDRLGRRPVVLAGYLLFAAASVLMGAATGLPALAASFALYGAVMAVMETVQRAFIAESVPAGLRATAQGVYWGAMGLCALGAGLVAGALWNAQVALGSLGAMRATFAFSAGTSLAAAAAFLVAARGEASAGTAGVA